MALIDSISGLGRAIGVSQRTAALYLQRPDWPSPRQPPWSDADLATIQEWRKTLQEDRSRPPGVPSVAETLAGLDPALKAKVEVLLKQERMLHEKLKREILEGRYVLRDLLDGALGGLANLLVQTYDEMEMAAPMRFGGKTSAQIEQAIGPMLDGYRQRIVDKAEFELLRIAELSRRVGARRRGRPDYGPGGPYGQTARPPLGSSGPPVSPESVAGDAGQHS